jgi:P-type conjugative transfer protein TrbJ
MRVAHIIMGSLLATAAVCAPARPAAAQIAVIDPANLAQSISQVNHMVEQLRNQVRQIEQASAMLRTNPLQLSPELSQSIAEARALFESIEGVAFEAERLGEDIRTLYPETWEAHDLQSILDQSEAWRAESRAGLTRAMEAEARAIERLGTSRDRLARALQSSGQAEGQTGAIQAGNQVLGIQSGQLAEIEALLIAQGRALEVERMERLAREDRADEIRRRAFPTESRVPAVGARDAF